MIVRNWMNDGLSVTAFAFSIASRMPTTFSPPSTFCTCQPYASYRVGDVLGQRDVRVVLDRDLVVVVEHDQVAQLLPAGDRATPREVTPSSMSPSEAIT